MTYFGIFILLTILSFIVLTIVDYFASKNCLCGECGEKLYFSHYKSKGKIKSCYNSECSKSENFFNKKVRVRK